jgi:redox-sensing transcriptional repressor
MAFTYYYIFVKIIYNFAIAYSLLKESQLRRVIVRERNEGPSAGPETFAERKVSRSIIHRLPRYRRVLGQMMQRGIERTSSGELGELLGYTASQIRQDLHNFGGFGQQGYGYNVRDLFHSIGDILGLDVHYSMALVGAGRLGQSLWKALDDENIRRGGTGTAFTITGAFDVKPELFGVEIGDVKIQDVSNLEQFLRDNKVDMGILTANAEDIQSIADILVEGGVRGIWNFSPDDIIVPDSVAVVDVHMRESMQELAYYTKLKQMEQE